MRVSTQRLLKANRVDLAHHSGALIEAIPRKVAGSTTPGRPVSDARSIRLRCDGNWTPKRSRPKA